MSKKDFLTDLADYCVCEQVAKSKLYNSNRMVDKSIKKRSGREKYEFPVRKFQQLERYFLKSPYVGGRKPRNNEQKNRKPRSEKLSSYCENNTEPGASNHVFNTSVSRHMNRLQLDQK